MSGFGVVVVGSGGQGRAGGAGRAGGQGRLVLGQGKPRERQKNREFFSSHEPCGLSR